MNEPNPPLSDYIKPLFSLIKKKRIHKDDTGMFEKFKEVLTQLQVSISFHETLELISKFSKFMQVLLKDGKQRLTKG